MAHHHGDAIGAGSLSPEARARLARRPGDVLAPPPIDRPTEVARWRRSVNRAWLDGDPPAEECGHHEETIAGVRVLRTRPAAGRPLLLYLHGGGYALGSPEVSLPITERLARAGLEVVSVDYRLAPEHPCPAGIDDAIAVGRHLTMQASDRPIVLAGDSAGANLAISAALELVGDGRSVSGLVVLSPHVDHGSDEMPSTAAGRPSDVDRAAAEWLRVAYQGSLSPDDPRLSPLRVDLAGLPPMLIQVGTLDTSFEQSIRLARRARVAGVEVTLDVWEGLWHTWHYHRDLPEADRALLEASHFARRLATGGV